VLAGIWDGVSTELFMEEVQPDEVGPRDVVIEVRASGICHTDVAILQGHLHPTPPPAIVGHEAAGVVVEIGSEVALVSVGDTVIGTSIPSCGRCFWCMRGQAQLCAGTRPMWSGAWRARRPDGTPVRGQNGLGTFAERMIVDELSAIPVTTKLPFDQLALIGCGVSVGVGSALNAARIEPGSAVAVIGCGGVGLSMIQGAAVAAATVIVAIDPVPFKREMAERLGATASASPTGPELAALVEALTDGRGFDYVLEATGLPSAQAQALELTRRGGATLLAGTRLGTTVTIETEPMIVAEKRLLTSIGGSTYARRDFQRYVDMAESGHLNLAEMVSAHYPLAEAPKAISDLSGGELVRAILVP
jgi:S-(hydroxymethyl)glutathione dehydrogenase / alcohol dehydrogenase